jgi:hypothetical protein
MKAVDSSETLVHLQITWSHIPEYRTLNDDAALNRSHSLTAVTSEQAEGHDESNECFWLKIDKNIGFNHAEC